MPGEVAAIEVPRDLSEVVGEAGADNAALSAIAMLAISDESLADKLTEFRKQQQQAVFAMSLPTETD